MVLRFKVRLWVARSSCVNALLLWPFRRVLRADLVIEAVLGRNIVQSFLNSAIILRSLSTAQPSQATRATGNCFGFIEALVSCWDVNKVKCVGVVSQHHASRSPVFHFSLLTFLLISSCLCLYNFENTVFQSLETSERSMSIDVFLLLSYMYVITTFLPVTDVTCAAHHVTLWLSGVGSGVDCFSVWRSDRVETDTTAVYLRTH